MLFMRTTTHTLSCPRCNTVVMKLYDRSIGNPLLRLSGQTIGSPLLTCPNCGLVAITYLRCEWYNYPNKAQLFYLPVLLPVILLILGSLGGDFFTGTMFAIFGLLISLCCTINYAIKILSSKKRMRNAAYLRQLRQFGRITDREFESFMRNAK